MSLVLTFSWSGVFESCICRGGLRHLSRMNFLRHCVRVRCNLCAIWNSTLFFAQLFHAWGVFLSLRSSFYLLLLEVFAVYPRVKKITFSHLLFIFQVLFLCLSSFSSFEKGKAKKGGLQVIRKHLKHIFWYFSFNPASCLSREKGSLDSSSKAVYSSLLVY